MRKDRVTIKTGSTDGFFNRVRGRAEKLDRGESLPAEITISFEDPMELLNIRRRSGFGCCGTRRQDRCPSLTSPTVSSEMFAQSAEIRVIGRFQLLERVGQGSFGAVWRARDTQLDRVVALKVPHEHALECGLDTERVAREARVAAQLRHPGIVRLYEIIALDDVPVLVSDFIDGMSLKAVLEKRRLTFRESALLVAQIAEALDHAHDHGLVHRDIKPANIMMEHAHRAGDRVDGPAGEPGSSLLGRPIVVDFGLAVRPEADTVMTVNGEIVGTPAYMSPELAAGRRISSTAAATSTAWASCSTSSCAASCRSAAPG